MLQLAIRMGERMKIIIIALIGFAFATIANGDESIEPRHYTFVVMSPTRRCYAVQTLVGWKRTNNKFDLTVRFQVFDTPSGKLLWQANKEFGIENEVFISDDTDSVVIMNSWMSSCGISGMHDGKVKDAPLAKQVEILNQVAVEFYRRDKLLAKYSLADLGFSADGLELSVSHVRWLDVDSAKRMGHWDWPEAELAKVTNPRFLNDAHELRFYGGDSRERVFDYRTGKLIKIESAEEAAERIAAWKRKSGR